MNNRIYQWIQCMFRKIDEFNVCTEYVNEYMTEYMNEYNVQQNIWINTIQQYSWTTLSWWKAFNFILFYFFFPFHFVVHTILYLVRI